MPQRVQLTRAVRFVTDSITRPATTTQYAIGDALSEVTTNDFFTFLNCLDDNTKTGTIVEARLNVSSYVATAPDIDLRLFHTAITETADNVAWTPTDAHLLTEIGAINFATGSYLPGSRTGGAGGNQSQIVTGLKHHVPVVKGSGVSSIFAQAVLGNAYIPVASEIYTVTLTIEQN